MTPLRKKMIDEMTLGRLAPKTQEAYLSAIRGLARFYNHPPDRIEQEKVQAYLLHLMEERKLAWSSINIVFSALRYFYHKVLKWDDTEFHIPPRPRQRKIPMLLSREEVHRLIDSITNPKHRCLLLTVYSAGLRVSEVVSLKPRHIERERGMIRIEQGKGRKDRYTLLSERLLDELDAYWKLYRPNLWLFPGRHPEQAITISTAQKIYDKAKRKSGISRGRGIHTLRHCFASHLLDQGIDIYLIKEMMGHRAITTTFGYLHTSQARIAAVRSPLDTFPG